MLIIFRSVYAVTYRFPASPVDEHHDSEPCHGTGGRPERRARRALAVRVEQTEEPRGLRIVEKLVREPEAYNDAENLLHDLGYCSRLHILQALEIPPVRRHDRHDHKSGRYREQCEL